MEAVDRAQGEIFAQVLLQDGSQGYYSLLITHKDSAIHSLNDVLNNPGKYTFGNGDPNSTSGFLIPSYYVFALNHVTPQSLFKRVVTANHETNIMAVMNKQVDLATNNNIDFEKVSRRMPERAADIRIVWKSPLIPNDPLVWRTDLDGAVKTKIRTFLLGYGQGTGADKERERTVLAALTWAGFRASSNDQLLAIRQIELFREKTKLEADDSVPAADKKAKLAEMDAKLAELQKKVAGR
jgi:phosphonate transport system substrate-binding protein